MGLPAIIAVPVIIHIAGTALPASDFNTLPDVIADAIISIRNKETFPQAILRMAPHAAPIIASVSDAFVPGSSYVELAFVFMVAHAKPPTAEEQERMWERAVGHY